MKIIFTFLREMLVVSKYLTTFAPQLRKYIFPDLVAQMAESVDALVSNTSGATHPGSIPGLGTRKKAKYLIIQYLAFSFYRRCSQIVPNHPYVFRQRWGIYFMPSITFSIESGFSIIRNTESESNPIYSI